MLNEVVIRDARHQEWLVFRDPVHVFEASTLAAVLPVLHEIERAVNADHLHAAGFISYEAAPAFDDCLAVRPAVDFPLLWFGLYHAPRHLVALPRSAAFDGPAPQWTPSVSAQEYRDAIARVKTYIHAGDSYQVNFTYRLRAALGETPWSFFRRLADPRSAPYAAYVETDRYAVCSASPELFLELDGNRILSKPMKGTAPRGLTLDEDLRKAETLHASAKNRAENVMIVDMIRNDLGRIARPGSVKVTALYELEKYPTLWQMTSTVEAETAASLTDILRATFPCSSITGAPKRRTMQIIAELEGSPRQIYTGSMGYLAPGRRAQFNVAIRTAWVDRSRQALEYGVGGGVVWDSVDTAELEESLTKARILTAPTNDFALLESILWTPRDGLFLWERHLQRLMTSAAYFSFAAERNAIEAYMAPFVKRLPPQPHKLRLTVALDGSIAVEAQPLTTAPVPSKRLALAAGPVDSSDAFLYHKTTQRQAYAAALAAVPGATDVILWNERGEITESCLANIVVELDGKRWTPPQASGLLAGTYRAELLDHGDIAERTLTKEELLRSPRITLINSVRREWCIEVL